jgi:hypothetical protein
MTRFRWKLVLFFAVFSAGAAWLCAQTPVRPNELFGTWQLVRAKDLKTGAVTQSTGAKWIQFTKSHWAVIGMEDGRAVIPSAAFEKLSADEKVKANYARVWTETNDQIFQARAGSYSLTGNTLRRTAGIALQTDIIGVDLVLKIIHLDKSTLVVQTEFPDVPSLRSELTYRRLD